MNDNQNDKKQLNCSLHTVASESLKNSVALDLEAVDRNLEDTIKEQQDEVQDSKSAAN